VSSQVKLETVKTYYDPDTRTRIHLVYTVKAGTPIKHGIAKEYSESGDLINVLNFQDNKLNGQEKLYMFGDVIAITTYKNGEKVKYETYAVYKNEKDNVKSKTLVYANEEVIKTTLYFDDGTIKSIEQENGENKEYDESTRKLKFIVNKKNGRMHGISKQYYSNGKIEFENNFKNDIRISKKYYSIDGFVYQKDTLVNELLNRYFKTIYDKNSGKVILKAYFKKDYNGDDLFDDIMILNDLQGNRTFKQMFEEGKRIGTCYVAIDGKSFEEANETDKQVFLDKFRDILTYLAEFDANRK
jgi:antitoxin component YwqK of YwqJK toxin-antitoxin module